MIAALPSERAARVQGLTTAEADARLQQHGPNALPEASPERLARRLARQLRSPLIALLILAVAVDVGAWLLAGARGVPTEAIVIAVILAGNALLGAWQERRAEHALASLKRLAAPQVWVWRDGVLRRLAARFLVPEDVVRIEAGERVPADVRASSSENVLVDESTVTGESLPVEKAVGEMLLAGTLVVRGRVVAVVQRTGRHSALGAVAAALEQLHPEPTPLERQLDRFGRLIARVVVVIAATLLVAGIIAGGWDSAGEIFLFAVALAVAAVPEGLPAVLTLTLALGVERMARRRAVVRRLAAVEALGSVTVIATDKTGTLTENRLAVNALEAVDPAAALRAMVFASDADAGDVAGDPLEIALLDFAAARGADAPALRDAAPRLSSRSFESASRYMRVTVLDGAAPVSYLKGAPELLLERASLPPGERASWSQRIESAAAAGFRTLGLARSPGDGEVDIEWLGFVTIWDPPRPEVPAAIREALAAGIRIIMITGDHPATARTVARHVGLPVHGVVTGRELERLSTGELQSIVRQATIFARMDPGHKLRIVEALQAGGQVVAMTGDGVNDAPALKRADVGVAMGQRGSDVAREVADLILLDDNFATIVHAVQEGRSMLENIQKFVRFLFSTNLSEVLVVGIAALAGVALGIRDGAGLLVLPLTAAQLLWINLLTDGAPALALGLDRNPGVMDRPPRAPNAPLLDGPSRRFILTSGTFKAAVALALMTTVWLATRGSVPATRTATFAFLALGQLLYAYPARRSDGRPLANRWLHIAVLSSFALQLPVLAIPALSAWFDATPPTAFVVAALVVAVLISWGAAELVAYWVWRRERRQTA